MVELFDFIKILFTDSFKFSSITPGEKRKHFFITNRRMGINFPLQANALQHTKINQEEVVNFWHVFLRKQYKYVPNWMYTKGIKKTQEIKEKKTSISNEILKEYCKYYNVDRKNLMDSLEFFPEDTLNELKKFEKLLKQQS